jgi:hypothetical protein
MKFKTTYKIESDTITEAVAASHLLAAAPVILAALKRLVSEHADLGELDLDDDQRDALEQARLAIAQAEGKSEVNTYPHLPGSTISCPAGGYDGDGTVGRDADQG